MTNIFNHEQFETTNFLYKKIKIQDNMTETSQSQLEEMTERVRLGINTRNDGKRERSTQHSQRPLEELLNEEYFTVNDVLGTNKQKVMVPQREIYIGSKATSYETGIITELYIDVIPRTNTPIRELVFKGNSAVRTGDYIKALIPACSEDAENASESSELPRNSYLYQRPYNSTERAIELKIIDPYSLMLLRTDRSAEYDRIVSMTKDE